MSGWKKSTGPSVTPKPKAHPASPFLAGHLSWDLAAGLLEDMNSLFCLPESRRLSRQEKEHKLVGERDEEGAADRETQEQSPAEETMTARPQFSQFSWEGACVKSF